MGWTFWDPIGLAPLNADCEDEYDTYLLQAAGKLWHAVSDDQVRDYLIHIEQEHMGLGARPSAKERASALVSALKVYIPEVRRGA